MSYVEELAAGALSYTVSDIVRYVVLVETNITELASDEEIVRYANTVFSLSDIAISVLSGNKREVREIMRAREKAEELQRSEDSDVVEFLEAVQELKKIVLQKLKPILLRASQLPVGRE